MLAGHSERVYGLAFSPDGRTLATASSDRTVRLWEVRKAAARVSLPHHYPMRVPSVAFLPDGNKLLTPDHPGGTPKLWFGKYWNPETGELERSVRLPGTAYYYFAVCPARRLLAFGAAGGGGKIYLMHLAAEKPHITLPGHETFVDSLAFSPDGRFLASSGTGGILKVWDPAAGKELPDLQTATLAEGFHKIAFSPDGNTLASYQKADVRLCNLATREVRYLPTGHTDDVSCVAYCPDGKLIATGSKDRSIKFFDTETGRERASLVGHHDRVTALAFSPDARTLASGGERGELRLWDVFTAQELFPLPGQRGTVTCALFSFDGSYLATAPGGAPPGSGRAAEVSIWRARRSEQGQTTKDSGARQ